MIDVMNHLDKSFLYIRCI